MCAMRCGAIYKLLIQVISHGHYHNGGFERGGTRWMDLPCSISALLIYESCSTKYVNKKKSCQN